MEFTAQTVQKLAAMGKLTLSPEKQEKLAKELSDILSWADQLAEVDVTGVEPTSQVTGLTHVVFADEPETAGFAEKDARSWLDHTSLPVELGHIKVPKVL